MNQNNGIYSVKGIVTDALKKSRLLKQGLVQGNWSKIVGKELAKKSYVAMIKNQVLIVHVENSVWLQQFSFMKRELIEKTNDFLELDYIRDLHFKVSPMNMGNYFTNEVEDKNFEPEKVYLDRGTLNKVEEIGNKIEDDEIKYKIKKLMILSKKREKFLLEEDNNLKCIDCGVLFKGSGIRCTACENKLRSQKLELIYEYIKTKPNVKYKEMNMVLKDLRETEFEDIKEKIKTRCNTEMHRYIHTDEIDKYKEKARIYFALETGVEDEEELEFTVNNYLLRIEEY